MCEVGVKKWCECCEPREWEGMAWPCGPSLAPEIAMSTFLPLPKQCLARYADIPFYVDQRLLSLEIVEGVDD